MAHLPWRPRPWLAQGVPPSHRVVQTQHACCACVAFFRRGDFSAAPQAVTRLAATVDSGGGCAGGIPKRSPVVRRLLCSARASASLAALLVRPCAGARVSSSPEVRREASYWFVAGAAVGRLGPDRGSHRPDGASCRGIRLETDRQWLGTGEFMVGTALRATRKPAPRGGGCVGTLPFGGGVGWSVPIRPPGIARDWLSWGRSVQELPPSTRPGTSRRGFPFVGWALPTTRPTKVFWWAMPTLPFFSHFDSHCTDSAENCHY